MPEFLQGGLSAEGEFAQSPGGALAFVGMLTLAALLGAALAWHPARLRASTKPNRFRRYANTQILIAVAGALLVLMVAGSIERAFGLVGLGSFVRFRNAVRDPMDTALMFLLVGVGMACGIGMILHAILATIFLWILLWFLSPKPGGKESAS